MKRIILLVLVAAAGFFAYKAFIDVGPVSAQQREIRQLEEQLDSAHRQFVQAGRTAGVSGIDTTADVSAARAKVRRVEQSLDRLEKTAASEQDRKEIERLDRKLRELKRRLGD